MEYLREWRPGLEGKERGGRLGRGRGEEEEEVQGRCNLTTRSTVQKRTRQNRRISRTGGKEK